MSGTAKISGVAYSAGTFGFDATLIEKTRLECIAGAVQTANGVAHCTGCSSCANGHLVSGSASINNLMLAFCAGLLPALVTTTPFTLFGLTLSASVAGHRSFKVWSSSLRLAEKLHDHRPVVDLRLARAQLGGRARPGRRHV